MTFETSSRTAASTLFLATALAVGSASAQEIDVWTLNFDAEAQNEALQAIAEEFEAAHPGVDIVYSLRSTDEHKTALRVTAGSDTGPDIFFSWAGQGLGGEYVDAGMSMPLDRYYEQYGWKDTLVPTAAAFASSYNDNLHGVPMSFRGEAVYYDKRAFEMAGIDAEPQTYEELVAAAEALGEAGIPAFTFGGSVNWHLMRLMDVLLETTCGAETHDALVAMEVDWAEAPCATESFEELRMWTQSHVLSPFMGIDHSQAFNLFVAGRAAMMLEGNWLVGQLDEGADLENYGVFPFPTGTDRLYGFANYLYINTKSEHPDVAAAFLDYFNSQDVQQRYLGTLHSNSVNADVIYEGLRPLDAEWADIFSTHDAVFVNGDQGFPTNVTTEYFRVINEVASGTMEPASATQQLQTFIDNLT